MTNITNHFEPGSCIFEAGSTMNGDVHITGGTFYLQGQSQEKEASQIGLISENNADIKKLAHRGPQPKCLFWLNGNEDEENEGVRNREKERFLKYLAEHKMSNRMLNCTSGNIMNEIIICFVMQWREAGVIAKQPSGRSVFRFLTQECELKTSVTEKAFANKFNLGLKEKKYSIETLRSVKKCFL